MFSFACKCVDQHGKHHVNPSCYHTWPGVVGCEKSGGKPGGDSSDKHKGSRAHMHRGVENQPVGVEPRYCELLCHELTTRHTLKIFEPVTVFAALSTMTSVAQNASPAHWVVVAIYSPQGTTRAEHLRATVTPA